MTAFYVGIEVVCMTIQEEAASDWRPSEWSLIPMEAQLEEMDAVKAMVVVAAEVMEAVVVEI